MVEDNFFYDSREHIEQCLSCKRPRCTNCMREGGKGFSLERDKIDHDKFMEMYNAGMNDVEIGRYFGVTKKVIFYYRKERNLPSKRPYVRRKKHVKS